MIRLAQDQLLLSARLTGTLVDASHDVEPEQFERDPDTGMLRREQATQHLLDLALLDLELEASLGVSDTIAIELRLPLRIVNVDAAFVGAGGAVLENFESIHHRHETLFGPGDLELAVRIRVLAPEHAGEGATLDLRLGATAPTGDIEPNPFDLGARGERHQHIFFGSGTIDPTFGLDLNLPLSEGFALQSLLSGRATLYRNVYGLRRGAKLLLGTKLAANFGSESLVFRAGPELYHEVADSWTGGEHSRNSGRTDLIAALGFTWSASDRSVFDLNIRRPFVLRSEGGQLEIPITIGIGFQQLLDL